jgi:cyclic di-GMP phosphodiesterase
MEEHPVIGDRLLEPIDVLAAARPIVRHHHERWDGDGFPDGLAGEAIPLAARIVAVADSVEVMSRLLEATHRAA